MILVLSCILFISEMVRVNKYVYEVVDFSLCNDERFRDLGGFSNACSRQGVLSTIFVFV